MRIAVYDDSGKQISRFGYTFDMKNTTVREVWYAVEFVLKTLIEEDRKKAENNG